MAQWESAPSVSPGEAVVLGSICAEPNYVCNGAACCTPDEDCCSGGCFPSGGGFCCGNRWCYDINAYCVDGQCCDAPCDGACQGCTAALKGYGPDGICGNITAGTDPENECPAQTGCGLDGFCSGGASCHYINSGTSCGTTMCSGGVVTGASCNGSGSCLTGSTSCAPYLCQDTVSCASSCADSSQCVPSSYCRSDHTCQPDQANGLSCGAAGECKSGNCVDGVCCDGPCTGLCQACSAAKKGTGASGTCDNIQTGSDPDNECPDDGAASCGRDGTCNGGGACRKYASGTSCGATSCASGSQSGHSCDGFGVCNPTNVTGCAPYVCNGQACGTSCTNDTQCVSSSYCRLTDHTCQPDLANGGSCSTSSQCQSGICIDTVCCDQNCTGLCQACSAAKKGSGVDGVCGNIKAGSDPDNDCVDDGATTCGRDGKCNGSGACELYTNGTGCGATMCSNGTQTGYACNGLGTCNASSMTACSPYVCGSTTLCGTTCNDDTGCISSYFCRTTDHTCQPDKAKGLACSSATQCTGGNCVDNFCCDGPCTGSCQACSAAKKGSGADGTCGAIAVGTDPDSECPDDGASSCQRNGVCDGVGACQRYTSGTACGATTCASGSQTGYACNGSGVCQAAQMTACAPYVCQNGACGGSCGSDVDCVAPAYCDSTSHCIPDQANGASCTSASQCTSGQCVDGVCCDQICTGTCRACSAAKKGGGADGVCSVVAKGTDPDDDCAVDPPSTCQKSGTCDGAGACALYASGISCGTSQCSGSKLTGQQCNGLGACVAGGASQCDPYLCFGSSCPATCGDDNGCVAAAYCAAGTCQIEKAVGLPCSAAHECSAGFCVEGICCNTACNGLCQACKAATKVSGTDGTCGVAKAGTDPHNDCPDDGPLSCKRDGACDGTAACRLYASGSACGPTKCVGNDQTGFACSGTGECSPNTTTPCKLQACSSGACTPSCVNDGDCASNAYCDTASSMCVEKHINGTACDVPSTCSSGICVDGVCCDQACGGQCQACDVPTSKGTCSPVVGPAHGGRDKCPTATVDDVCSARACDGAKSIGSCVGYAGAEVGCRDESCKDGVETFSATCDGTGQCGPGGPAKTKVCQPYVCKATACGAAPCASDADCSSAFRCDATKKDCVPRSAATCDGDHTVTAANGKDQSDCSPFRCEASGICKMACVSVDDCAAGFACSADLACVPPPSAGSDPGSCSCRIGSRDQPQRGAMLAGFVAAALWISRGRRHRGRRKEPPTG